MFKIFVAESALKAVVLSESAKPKASQSSLYKIMRKRKKLYVSKETEDTSWSVEYKEKYGLTLDFSKSDYIKNIPTQPETVLQNPSSVFILDIPITEAEKIQKSYGVICLSKELPNLSMLIDTNDEHTIGEREPLGNGWDTVLKSIKPLPSNTLILTDRYLFSNISPKTGDGIINVQRILDTLLPQRFLGEYHVIIVFDKESMHSSFTFSLLVAQLNQVKLALHREYPINLEILGITQDCEVYNKLHNRRIVSNYYVVKVEHKLAAFDKNLGTCMQTITPQTLFTIDSLNNNSTSPLKSIDHITAILREFSGTAPKLHNHDIYSYALNNKVMEKCTGIKNRILK